MTGWCDELRLNSFTFPSWVLGATFTLQPIHYYPYNNFRSLENISTINWNYCFSKWFFYQNFSTARPISTDCCISFKYLNTNLLYHYYYSKSYGHMKYLETSVCASYQERACTLTMTEQYLSTKTEWTWGCEMKKLSLGDNQVRNALLKQCSDIKFFIYWEKLLNCHFFCFRIKTVWMPQLVTKLIHPMPFSHLLLLRPTLYSFNFFRF